MYRVYIDDVGVFAHEARVSARPVNQIWRGFQRPMAQTEAAAFVSFDMDKPVNVRVKCDFEVFNAFVKPDAAKIAAKRDGDEVCFVINSPGQYALDVNGVHNTLHIFANAAVCKPPEGALYFGPGVHKPGVINAESGQTIYIAEGAVVYCAIEVNECERVKIMGRGIIDGSRLHRETRFNVVKIQGSREITVDGIVIRDSPTYALSSMACEDVMINNVKVIGQWRYNADGLDLHNTRCANITNCFVRTFDDCIVLKSREDYYGYGAGGMCLEDVLIERCTLWNDWGRALEIGAETMGSYMRNIIFRDCDIIHFLFIACDVQACGNAEIYNVLFENIRVGEPLDPACEPRLIEIFIWPMCWLTVEKLGSVRDVSFRDIKYTGLTTVPCRFIGYGVDCDIKNIKLEQIKINNRQLTAEGVDMSPIIVNNYVTGLTVDGVAVCPERVRFEDEAQTNEAFLIGNGAFI